MGTNVKGQVKQHPHETHFESLDEIVLAVQKDGTFVGTDIDVTGVYMHRPSTQNPADEVTHW